MAEQDTFFSDAYEMAVKTLRDNITEIHTSDGETTKVLVAGQRNFREVWTRDACFSLLGLTRIKAFEPTKRTLSLIFSHQRDDGMIPRRFATMSNSRRTRGIVLRKDYFDPNAVAVPEFETGHHTTPVDQNALAVIALVDYVIASGDTPYGSSLYPSAVRAIDWLASKHSEDDLLIVQEPFADWIDLVKRPGKSLYTNVCYCKALQGLSLLAKVLGRKEDAEKYAIVADEIRKNIDSVFWMERRGYYKNTDTLWNFESSGNILAIVFNVADPQKALRILEKIKHSGIDTGLPLKTVDAPYPFFEIPLSLRLLGWSRYHNGDSWAWLGNMYAIALHNAGKTDEARSQLQKIAQFVSQDSGFMEVYRNQRPVNSLTYRSETGFSWAAGTFVLAAHKLNPRLG